MNKKIFVFLFDGFSDWEISYLTPEINKSEQFDLVYFSKNGNTVTSMGGLQIKPASSLSELNFEDLDLLILPGGIAWEKGENEEITKFAKNAFEKGKTIAAICAATAYLGQLGLLNDLKHTSNDLNYLKGTAPMYRGEGNYQNSLAVTDRNIITANGIAPIEFAREIFKTIGLYNDDTIEKWFQLFKNGIWSE
ncbi:type 1 glutamine amidotransferase family protein [Labilibaculum sp.]|uniref:type 1 glutamine amidotransferase family protein n=1 Tax=Labilibaculum sp. TaxID=2060723 RepID=UPI002AA79542|nr:type 1 glutamine amidotransferase family protein [Labilibaculum sp.]MBN2598435.1 glutamine amidotransferase [Marinifilaceae bacterium]